MVAISFVKLSLSSYFVRMDEVFFKMTRKITRLGIFLSG